MLSSSTDKDLFIIMLQPVALLEQLGTSRHDSATSEHNISEKGIFQTSPRVGTAHCSGVAIRFPYVPGAAATLENVLLVVLLTPAQRALRRLSQASSEEHGSSSRQPC